MYCFDGVYYLYYSAMDDSNRRHNSVVKADNPLGPYEPIVNDVVDGLNNPVFFDSRTVLDSTIFVDDNGVFHYALSHSLNPFPRTSIESLMMTKAFSSTSLTICRNCVNCLFFTHVKMTS